VFPQLCHGCGSCSWHCESKAIKETRNPIGVLEAGETKDSIHFMRGVLTISEPMATPINRQIKRWNNRKITVLSSDAPPVHLS
jgi:MinD superfamily P-loop ATPase